MSKKIILHKKDKIHKEEDSTKKIIEKLQNYKHYIIVIFIFPVVLAIYFFLIKPKFFESNNLAHKEMYHAIHSFKNGNYDEALKGTTSFNGFVQISKKYKWTKAAQIANFYIGYIYLQRGNYKEALKHLKKFRINDYLIKPKAVSLLGDIYSQKKDYPMAISYYKKAARLSDNKIYSPKFLLKAAILYEKINDNKSAVISLRKIIDKYPKSTEVEEAKKMIYALTK